MKTAILKDEKLTTAAAFLERFRDAEIVKYAPGKRGLFAVKIERTDFFVKLYPKKFLRENRGEKIHQVGQSFWNLSQTGKLDFKVPPPVFWDAETRTLWQKKSSGTAAVEFLKRGAGAELAFQIGRAIADIAASEIVPPRVFDWSEQTEDSCEHAAKITEKFPRLERKTEKLLALLRKSQPAQRLVPTHGDMHIDQWLFDGESLCLLDFEDFSYAAAERELAFFAVQIEAEYGAEICRAATEKNLREGFESADEKIDDGVYQIYKAHKWLAKAAKARDEKTADEMLGKAFENLRTR